MRGKIGARGGSCGAGIYKDLLGIGSVLSEWSVEVSGKYARYEVQLVLRSSR